MKLQINSVKEASLKLLDLISLRQIFTVVQVSMILSLDHLIGSNRRRINLSKVILSVKRPILETKVFPTARIIGDISPTSSEIFVDNAQFFDYDEIVLDLSQNTFTFDAFMMDSIEPVSAAFTATVSIAGTVSGVSIANAGVGYTVTSADIKFSAS